MQSVEISLAVWDFLSIMCNNILDLIQEQKKCGTVKNESKSVLCDFGHQEACGHLGPCW